MGRPQIKIQHHLFLISLYWNENFEIFSEKIHDPSVFHWGVIASHFNKSFLYSVIVSTLKEELSGECRSTLSGISAPFYHRKHCFVMITHCFCVVQEKTVAKILLTKTTFLPAPWNSSSVYMLLFFLQIWSHLEAIPFQQRIMLLERA